MAIFRIKRHDYYSKYKVLLIIIVFPVKKH